MIAAIVLGAAAGGGFPQWNCACRLCERARAGDPDAPPRAETCVAVSADGEHWLLLGAPGDLRASLLAAPALRPRPPRRSPVAAVAVLGTDVDAIAGLLVLRERHALTLHAPHPVLAAIDVNPIFAVLDATLVRRAPLGEGETAEPVPGLRLRFVSVPGKAPPHPPAYAAIVEADSRRLVFAPSCARLDGAVLDELARADLVLFDGTVFTEDELAALGGRTGSRMGHAPVAGTLATLAALPGRVVLIHLNNTNPLLHARSAERRAVEAAGLAVAADGMVLAC